ncbi:MAG: 1-acyl-sn-glycerol-3-phosphate acyltransferase [Clostridia bacterium]|nr:1-acyl-sn-glycerol-3-phosphate acyltransferase [Clostridia bacterium]
MTNYAKSNTGFKILSTILKPIFKFWYSPKLIGKENIPENGAIVVACNHKHLMDQCMVIVSTKRPIHYMAKSEYFENKKVAWFFKAAGCIPVHRNGHDTDAKDAATEVLQSKGALGIFPEGTRNKTEDLLMPFKFGAVSLAKKNNALVIPVGVSGDYKFRPKNLVARIGEPIDVSEMDLEEANEKLHKTVEALILENLKEGNGSEQDFERAKHSGLIK